MAESAVNGRKVVVVFSYFWEVLEAVRRAIGTELADAVTLTGPINGSVPPTVSEQELARQIIEAEQLRMATQGAPS